MKIKFVGNVFRKRDANVITFGVNIGKDAKKSIHAVRKASLFVEPFDESGKNLLENVKIYDDGNLKIEYLDQIFEKVLKIRNKGKIPLIISRCHYPTLHALGAFGPNLHLIIFDAHLDLKNSYMDEKIKEMNFCHTNEIPTKEFNDSTWLRRFVEFSYNKNILIIGARSFDEDEINFAKKNGIKILTSNKIKENINKAKEIVKEFSSSKEVYVSLDIDVFDPSIAPAVDHPEPNGLNFYEFSQLIDSLNGKLVGLDLCCMKKIEGEVTEFLAVKSVFKILSKLKKRKNLNGQVAHVPSDCKYYTYDYNSN
jgi:agmatinase